MLNLSWDNVSFRQYLDILEIWKDPEIGEADRAAEVCDILFGVNILKMPIAEASKYTKALKILTVKVPDNQPLDSITVNGIQYEVTTDVANLTVAQFYDFDAAIRNGGKELENYPQIMACFIKPVGTVYGEGYNTQRVAEDVLDMPVTVVSSMAAFFLGWYKRYIKISLLFLRLKMMRMPKTARKRMKEEIKQMETTMNGAFSD